MLLTLDSTARMTQYHMQHKNVKDKTLTISIAIIECTISHINIWSVECHKMIWRIPQKYLKHNEVCWHLPVSVQTWHWDIVYYGCMVRIWSCITKHHICFSINTGQTWSLQNTSHFHDSTKGCPSWEIGIQFSPYAFSMSVIYLYCILSSIFPLY